MTFRCSEPLPCYSGWRYSSGTTGLLTCSLQFRLLGWTDLAGGWTSQACVLALRWGLGQPGSAWGSAVAIAVWSWGHKLVAWLASSGLVDQGPFGQARENTFVCLSLVFVYLLC